jgi:type I restriction enzyme S subunit
MTGTTQHTKDAKRILPPGWRWVRLGEVCVQDRALVDPKSEAALHLSYLGLENIESQTGRILKSAIGPAADEGISTTYAFDTRHVLYGKLRPYLNKVALPDFAGRCTTEVIPLLPKPELDKTYLCWLIRRTDTVAVAMRDVTGSRMPRADMSAILKHEIPLPPLPEQQRIAAILKEQMAAVDKARAAAEARLEAVKALPAAFRNQIFPRPDQKLAVDWKRKALGAVLEITSGQVDPKDARYKDLPHVNGENIESGTGRLLNVRSAAEDNMTSGKYLFESGVVLYSKLRPYLMKVSVAHFRGLCSADMYPLTPHLHEMTLEFLQQLLLSEAFTNYAVAESQRARMPKLNRDQLMAYSAPVPPLADQRRLAARLREQMDAAEKARAAAEAELDAINALPAALLRRAFNGGL